MGESKQHMDLVNKIKDHVENIPSIEKKMILCDLPDTLEKPISMLEGFRPDVFYKYLDQLIIGEAKTTADFSRKHSIEQYSSYLKQCDLFEGKALFILAVPWTEFVSAKNMLRRIKSQNSYNFEIRVINNINKMESI